MTDTARDVIAGAMPEALNTTYEAMPNYRAYLADNILFALTAAGYRILAPGELDGESLDDAAKVARECFDDPQAETDPDYVPAAIRSLKGGRNG